jgi:hypothetical protein
VGTSLASANFRTNGAQHIAYPMFAAGWQVGLIVVRGRDEIPLADGLPELVLSLSACRFLRVWIAPEKTSA